MSDMIWIRYLVKKGIMKKGVYNFIHNEKEKKEFKAMLKRLYKSQQKENEIKTDKAIKSFMARR